MLTGTKTALTELRAADSEVLFGWVNAPETIRLNAPYRPVHEASHRTWFESVTRDPSRVVFGIRRRESPALVGMLQLIDIHPVHRKAELVVRIGNETDRGQGLGTEAVRLAIAFAFDDLNLQRVWLRVFANNSRAVRAYEKAGMEVEGTMRRAVYIAGDWIDEVIMGILRKGSG